MSSARKKCPVPFDQQPLNEYLELKKSCFFAWSTYNIIEYLSFILISCTCLFILFGFIIFFFSFGFFNIFKLLILDFLIIDISFLFVCMRLYLGWSYLIERLLSATIFYEESGWYDGQIWIKTAESLTRDRLLGIYYIMPLINRIKYTCLMFCLNFILHYSLYCIL
uniref:Ycf36 n=1 Tax=Dasya naccarioides TaxID=2007180 RepID=A0A1Z1MH27_9FLOR|nr:hypothetical protein [Dasya naccarioides]ARW65199.1 hypothetical protein [Dasya naccarioides]